VAHPSNGGAREPGQAEKEPGMVGLRRPSITPGSREIVGSIDVRCTPKEGDKSGRQRRYVRQCSLRLIRRKLRDVGVPRTRPLAHVSTPLSTVRLRGKNFVAFRLVRAEALAEGAEE